MITTRWRGTRGFALLWLGQVASLLGGSMAVFAVTLWLYQKTGLATPVTLVGFFNLAPMVAVSLFAGTLVDRSSRRLMLALGDLASLAVSLYLIVRSSSGTLAEGEIYATAAVLGLFQSFQWPAESAAVTEMLDKRHYARAASLQEMAGLSSGLVAPLLAGALLGPLGLPGILLFTAVGSALALLSLLFLDLPRPPVKEPLRWSVLLREIVEAFRFVLDRPSLVALQSSFLIGNFLTQLCLSLLGPLVLSETGNNSLAFASVQTASALGGLVGGALIAWRGGFRNRVVGVLVGWTGSGLLGPLALGLGPGLPWWATGLFLASAVASLCYASNQSLWQSKVPVDLQGRVFSVRRVLGFTSIPLANLVAGPLADHVLGPAMRPGGAWASALGGVFGTGPGAGIRVLCVVCGLGLVALGPAAWAFRAVREAEVRLTDAR